MPTIAQARLVVSFAGSAQGFLLAESGSAAPVIIPPGSPESVTTAAGVFADDVQRVAGARPIVAAWDAKHAPREAVIVGVLGQSPLLDQIVRDRHLDIAKVDGKWETALTTVVDKPLPGVERALLIAGSDRRGVAFALFAISRAMGVSPWYWWADVPVPHHERIVIDAKDHVMPEASVPYRGIFLNDEDWGLRPWAAKNMDPSLHNIGPHTYAHIFELLLRLHANTLWPAMHPGSRPFNEDDSNAREADRWGIIMGSSHSEALLRNNVGEWDLKKDGPWNFQKNSAAMTSYWDAGLKANGKFENYYTVGLRGQHDGALEATGTGEEKAALVSHVIEVQRDLLAKRVNPDLAKTAQVLWVYKEALDLYRAGMKVPDDVTLGFTDDNFGYIRQLPNAEERKRSGGAGIYYHVSYWGAPHDYLWLCTTPPALIQEEMTKAYDAGARKLWILNVGDLKPAEMDIDYFLSLAADEPAVAVRKPSQFMETWFAEQFPGADAHALAEAARDYYRLNFIRKPEEMGFNVDKNPIQRTEFNPLAWGDQNTTRIDAWKKLVDRVDAIGAKIPEASRPAFFELLGYPVAGAAALNDKLLALDRAALDAQHGRDATADIVQANAAYEQIQKLTDVYNSMLNGKWSGMMDAAPRRLHVFDAPAQPDPMKELPAAWAAGPACDHNGGGAFAECGGVVSMAAAHYTSTRLSTIPSAWRTIEDLGMGEDAVTYVAPATDAQASDLTFAFTTSSAGDASLEIDVLPVFSAEANGGLRFAVAIDDGPQQTLSAAGADAGTSSANPAWGKNVLRNFRAVTLPLPGMKPGKHTLRLIAIDPGVIFEHITLRFAGAAPAYPAPPETRGPE